LNTTTSDTDGSDASPRMIFASGMPSSTLLLKMVPIAKIVCETPVHRERARRDDARDGRTARGCRRSTR
jgi:hypothetical protein